MLSSLTILAAGDYWCVLDDAACVLLLLSPSWVITCWWLHLGYWLALRLSGQGSTTCSLGTDVVKFRPHANISKLIHCQEAQLSLWPGLPQGPTHWTIISNCIHPKYMVDVYTVHIHTYTHTHQDIHIQASHTTWQYLYVQVGTL